MRIPAAVGQLCKIGCGDLATRCLHCLAVLEPAAWAHWRVIWPPHRGQDRYEAQIDLRSPDGWMRETLTSPDDELALPAFGLRCALKDLYRGTILLGDA